MIRRRKVLWITAAASVVGFAFAAQPTGYREDASRHELRPAYWVPGTSSPMSAFEPRIVTLAPPQ